MSHFSMRDKSCRIFQYGIDQRSPEKYDTTYWFSEKYAISWGSERPYKGHISHNLRHLVGSGLRQSAVTLPATFASRAGETSS
jgi:hypothetical protein